MAQTNIHTETTFEKDIVDLLTSTGNYQQGLAVDVERETGHAHTLIRKFITSSQPREWEKFVTIHQDQAKSKFLYRLNKEIESRGLLEVIRHGFTTHGVKFKMAYFKPESGLNPEAIEQYRQNILTVTRQVKYDRHNENSVDLLISLNGLSIITVELKNAFTGQTTANAERQYMFDRDAKEPLFHFNGGSLVHFAVDADTVSMTTRVNGRKTYYLPFNKGYNNGAGNPPNPQGRRTDYLWTGVLGKDSLMEIIGKFIHLEINKDGKQDKLIFPRYHQMDVVRSMIADARKSRAGKNYLVQHSAGSGKSNSIAWLSYRLASLHDNTDNRIFDSVVVVTDRRVLDNQLQNTIYQFEHKQGVVKRIDKDSKQLTEALEKGTNIIITTLQKFPYVLEQIGELPKRKYAVIVDEAHSSQGGEAAKKLKEVLSAADLDEAVEADRTGDEDYEDEIRKSMMARGEQSNLSFFAFTATPKFKTLEVFGVKDTPNAKPRPFHLYSMKQAIQEGFILDVLKNYTSYKTFFKLSKAIEDDPEVNKKRAATAIARFVTLHPHNLAQKTEVMVEHFRRVVSKKIGGRAKAMVVTGSRLHAVRYKHEIDRYIKEKGYTGISTLVAFSGTVRDMGFEYTEPQMTGFPEKQLPEMFSKDDYQVLIVADKYQTGFDQPLLHTMYVDKKLSGVRAVQTLSRLNRTHPGKTDTFVLDFVNNEDEMRESFQPYYELTTVKENTDPDHLYDLKNQIEAANIIWETEVEQLNKVYFTRKENLTPADHARLNAFIDPAVDRYRSLATQEEKENFKHGLVSFTRLYSFLSQIMPFYDLELEKLYIYVRFLNKKLPKEITDPFHLGDEVDLKYYRLQLMKDRIQVALEDQAEYGLDGIKDAGVRSDKEEKALLSEIIEILNDRFGLNLTDGDKLYFDQIEEELVSHDKLVEQAKGNTIENFRYGFDEVFINTLIKRMDQNQELFTKMMDDEEFSRAVKKILLAKVYRRLREAV
ncbi:MAG TPA: DEAD/DEAH box helicase family protein [Bacteroidales bacterium]|nr:DEAD/DEAH box helicase family protein [Bacteroidales bacterium]